MRITLHDNIHGSAGEAHPESRRPTTDAERAPWVKALHEWLRRAKSDGAALAGDLDFGDAKLRMRVSRHGGALAAVWSAAPQWEVVAASLVLPGKAPADDEAAIGAARAPAAGLPFVDADYAAVAAEPRPSLATLYLDARWFNNGRVELAATALALAALVGPDGRLTAPAERVLPDPQPPTFRLSPERVQVVMTMVKKKVDAAVNRVAGAHFRVYPPAKYLEHPDLLRAPDIFGRLKDSAWLVRWHDGRHDRLSLGEFLGFVHQVVEVGGALAGDAAVASGKINDTVWARRQPAGRGPVRLRSSLDPRELTRDATIRRLLGAVALERA